MAFLISITVGVFTLPVAVIAVGVVIIAVGVGFAIDWVDKKLNITDRAADGFRQTAEYLRNQHADDYGIYPGGFESRYGMGA